MTIELNFGKISFFSAEQLVSLPVFVLALRAAIPNTFAYGAFHQFRLGDIGDIGDI